jgi:hypothetical protein
MLPEVAALRKSRIANFALERFLSSMHAHMSLQKAALCKFLFAYITFKWPLSCVDTRMFLQVQQFSVPFAAHFTLMRLLFAAFVSLRFGVTVGRKQTHHSLQHCKHFLQKKINFLNIN